MGTYTYGNEEADLMHNIRYFYVEKRLQQIQATPRRIASAKYRINYYVEYLRYIKQLMDRGRDFYDDMLYLKYLAPRSRQRSDRTFK